MHQVAEQAHLGVGHAPHDVVRRDLARMREPGGLHQFLQRVQRAAVEVAHALGLVGTTSACWRSGSCVVTPVGQLPVWQVCAWMQPSAIMKPRAALHQSAPSAIIRAMSKAVITLPGAADA